MKVTLTYKGGVFVPSNNYDKQRIEYEYYDGDILRCNIKKGRTYKRLGEYWLIMTALAYQHGANREHWHNEFKKEILGVETVKNIITGEVQTVIPSISFEAMRQEERFERYLTDVKRLLLDKGIDYKELIEQLPSKRQII